MIQDFWVAAVSCLWMAVKKEVRLAEPTSVTLWPQNLRRIIIHHQLRADCCNCVLCVCLRLHNMRAFQFLPGTAAHHHFYYSFIPSPYTLFSIFSCTLNCFLLWGGTPKPAVTYAKRFFFTKGNAAIQTRTQKLQTRIKTQIEIWDNLKKALKNCEVWVYSKFMYAAQSPEREGQKQKKRGEERKKRMKKTSDLLLHSRSSNSLLIENAKPLLQEGVHAYWGGWGP